MVSRCAHAAEIVGSIPAPASNLYNAIKPGGTPTSFPETKLTDTPRRCYNAPVSDAKLEFLRLGITEVILDPANARKHDARSIEAIKGSLAAFGQQTPIVVDLNNIVVKGNGTVVAARELDWKTIAAVRTDLTGARRVAYAIADNRTAELAEWDRAALKDLLQSIDTGELDMNSTGFDERELEIMMTANADLPAGKEWGGMPEFHQPDQRAFRQIIVNFKTEEDAQDFAQIIGQKLSEKTRSIWHPEAEIEHTTDKAYKAE